MAKLFFTKDHEYLSVDGDIATVGISDYAQNQLGDVVFVDLPEIGKSFVQGQEIAIVESVKAANEIYAPVSGEVIAVNDDLNDEPAKVNGDAQGQGWFFKLKVAAPGEFDGLLDEIRYKAMIGEG